MSKGKAYKPIYTGSRALVIGINEYTKCNRLAFARNDAMAVAKVLKSDFGFSEKDVCVLLDAEATRDRIREAFLSYSNTDPDERLFFFFAGHGHTVTGYREEVGYLVPVDGMADKLASLIRWRELIADSHHIPAKHVFFIVDACFGGLIHQRDIGTAGKQRYRKDMMQRYSRQALTAGRADQSVSDGNGTRPGHSIFTSMVLDALDRTAPDADARQNASEVSHFVTQKVAKDGLSRQTPYYGMLEGDGDFYFDLRDATTVDTAISRAIRRSMPEATKVPASTPYVGKTRKE